MLQGKCRYCKKPISWQYPLIEISTALIFLQISNQFSNLPITQVIFLLAISSFLIVLFVYDLKHYILPDKILLPAIGIVALYNFGFWISDSFGIPTPPTSALLSALGAAGFFLFIFLVSRGSAMGFGDVKLAFLMGLFLGWPNILVALFTAFLSGAIVGIILILLKKKGMKSEVPFGPFLISGTFFALFWGADMVQWYKTVSGW